MYPEPYIQYLVHFHGDRDYFECHEILEEYWKRKPAGQRDIYWVGLIQIAVSLYHYRRQNIKGAVRMMKSAAAILKKEAQAIEQLGLDSKTLLSILLEQLRDMENRQPYTSMSLPIADPRLETACISLCHKRNLIWKSSSDLSNPFLLNKHTLRDRTDVIEERMRQIKRKQRF
ncbi:DUF309 domain-containing protein [Ectobacillus panaciterrae]|uniref:DUF309 domain-containing protein n=1 Tax=Ectobacillus panaciterrae TaxID=363872 RepID=UPI0003F623D4|nr:DUF309 domain-containing protein [Ectobacillus panaciterrae]